MRIKISSSVVNSFLDFFPVFKRKVFVRSNGDSYEETCELHADEKLDAFKVASSPDSFSDAVERVPDVSFIDRFDAIAQLNAAIANIQFEKPSDDEK